MERDRKKKLKKAQKVHRTGLKEREKKRTENDSKGVDGWEERKETNDIGGSTIFISAMTIRPDTEIRR